MNEFHSNMHIMLRFASLRFYPYYSYLYGHPSTSAVIEHLIETETSTSLPTISFHSFLCALALALSSLFRLACSFSTPYMPFFILVHSVVLQHHPMQLQLQYSSIEIEFHVLSSPTNTSDSLSLLTLLYIMWHLDETSSSTTTTTTTTASLSSS